VKKLVLLAVSVGAAASSIVLSNGVATSDPASAASLNVIGEPYGKAMGILKSQGVKGTFGGSVGSDLPQAQCIVDQQKVIPSGKMILMLNCTKAAAADAGQSAPAGSPGPASLGGNGITTVTATPVGPQGGGGGGPVHPGGT
jgi:hypothetical protein